MIGPDDIVEVWRATRKADPNHAEVLAGRLDSLRRTLTLCPTGDDVAANGVVDRWIGDIDDALAVMATDKARHDTQAPPSSGERRLRRPTVGPMLGLAERTARELAQGGGAVARLPPKGDERR